MSGSGGVVATAGLDVATRKARSVTWQVATLKTLDREAIMVAPLRRYGSLTAATDGPTGRRCLRVVRTDRAEAFNCCSIRRGCHTVSGTLNFACRAPMPGHAAHTGSGDPGVGPRLGRRACAGAGLHLRTGRAAC